MSDRLELSDEVYRLRRKGLTQKETAVALGISRSYASELDRDPFGTMVRERKLSYRGTCEVCGKRTDGSNGPSNAPKVCADCFSKDRSENRYWTRERVILELQHFGVVNGRPPKADEFLLSEPTYREHRYPPVATVQREFGSWHAGLIAAGFDVPSVGKYVRTEETRERMRAAWVLRRAG